MGAISHVKGSGVWAYEGKQYRSYNTAYKAFTKVSVDNLKKPISPLNPRVNGIENSTGKPLEKPYQRYAVGIALLILSLLLLIYFMMPYIRRCLG